MVAIAPKMELKQCSKKQRCIPIFNYNRLLHQIPRGVPHKVPGMPGETYVTHVLSLRELGRFKVSFTGTNIVICNPQQASFSRFQWPRGIRRRFAAAGLRVRIPPGAWMPLCCVCCEVEVSATS